MSTECKLSRVEVSRNMLAHLVREWRPLMEAACASTPDDVADFTDQIAEVHEMYRDFMVECLESIETTNYAGVEYDRGGRAEAFRDLMDDALDCFQTRVRIFENAEHARVNAEDLA